MKLKFCGFLFLLLSGFFVKAQDNWYEYNDNYETRWSTQENLNGLKGKGGQANNGAKGAPYDSIRAGESKVLLNVKEQGIINRIWITLNDRSPEMLRALKIEMFWDGESKPAVSAPFGDFFGVGLGKTARFHNAFFANPENRSFNCIIPMPFRKGAKVVVTNESKKNIDLFFFEVDFQLIKNWDDKFMYFHAYWNRDTATTLAKDFELLPELKGKGRYLGANIGVNANPLYKTSWWGEGEVKIFLDDDKTLPTLVGTGTEDYIGTGWGQSKFFNDYAGCLIANDTTRQWAYYRYHIPDPVFFHSSCKVVLQQIGGDTKENVTKMQQEKVPLIPVTINSGPNNKFTRLYKKGSITNLNDPKLPKEWTNFYRSDDVSATVYFYLNSPKSNLPALQAVALRTYNLKSK